MAVCYRWNNEVTTIFPDNPPITRPGLRFLFAHPAHFIAQGCGSGLSAYAPGTAGSLFALLTYPLLRPAFSEAGFGLFLLAGLLLGFWACQRTGRDLGVADHGSIVWDEIVPMWSVLWLTPPTWPWMLAAFLLFRLFDITKPSPANWIDGNMKNGVGVMLDDVVAAFYTLVVLALAKLFLG